MALDRARAGAVFVEQKDAAASLSTLLERFVKGGCERGASFQSVTDRVHALLLEIPGPETERKRLALLQIAAHALAGTESGRYCRQHLLDETNTLIADMPARSVENSSSATELENGVAGR